jgi:galactokinase
VGAGVSSSAALEVSMLRGLRELFDLDLDDLALARIGQAAESEFVGAPVGIMDQMAASLGRDGEALFIDTGTLCVDRLPLPSAMDLIVVNSAIPHAHAHGQYGTRRRESFDAAALLGVARLRELTPGDLPRLAELPPLLSRRARHVITENQRVLDAIEALRAGDLARLGCLLNASHVSMRDDYETSTSAIDKLVRIAQNCAGVYGARLTGGGFGGSIVAIAKAGTARTAAEEICRRFATATNRDAQVLVPR